MIGAVIVSGLVGAVVGGTLVWWMASDDRAYSREEWWYR